MAIPLIIPLALTALSGAATIMSQNQQVKAQEAMLKKRARDEETAAKEQELSRRQEMNQVLARQAAMLGASGIAAEGSPQRIAQVSLEQGTLGDLAGTANLANVKQGLQMQASAARDLNALRTATTLFSTGANMFGQL